MENDDPPQTPAPELSASKDALVPVSGDGPVVKTPVAKTMPLGQSLGPAAPPGIHVNLYQQPAAPSVEAQLTPENTLAIVKSIDKQNELQHEQQMAKIAADKERSIERGKQQTERYKIDDDRDKRRAEDRKTHRRDRYIFAGVIILVSVGAALYLVRIGQGPLVEKLMTHIGALFAGAIGGYGYGTRKKDEKGE